MSLLAAITLLLFVPADRIVLIDGTVLSGTVLSESFDTVVYENKRGDEKRLDARQVARLEYDDAPAGLKRASQFLAQDDFQNAVQAYQACEAEGDRDWVAERAMLGKCRALLRWSEVDQGRTGEASAAWREFLASYPESRFLVEAKTGLGLALGLAGDVDEAASTFEQLTAFAFDKNLGQEVENEARLQRGLVFLRGGQSQVAETRLRSLVISVQDLISSAGDLTPHAREQLASTLARARIGLGEAISHKDGPQAARTYWDGLLRDRSLAPQTRSAASIGLAEAALAAGEARQAQLALAKVVATYPGSDTTLAKALYLLAESTAKLGDNPSPSADYYEEVITRFPASRWAALARQRLGR